MPIFFPRNLKFIREKNKQNQEDTAKYLGLGRSTYANYEAGATFPKYEILENIVLKYGFSVDEMLFNDMSLGQESGRIRKEKRADTDSKIIIEKERLNNVYDFVSLAAAGSAIQLLEKDKYREAPNILLPDLGSGIHVRVPISGDSMHSTVKDGDKVVATHITEIKDIRQGHIYLILDAEDGLCCKRLYVAHKNQLELVSDNEIYKPYKRNPEDILALFKVREIHSTNLQPDNGDVRMEIREIKNEILSIKNLLQSK